MKWTIASLALVFASACGTDLPSSWKAGNDRLSVTVTRAPYGFTVSDASGKQLLATRGDGAQDGYGSVGYTTGTVSWMNIATLGYYDFGPDLDPWRDRWTVTAATATPSEIDVTLTSPDGGKSVLVKHLVEAADLRVEASTTSDTPRAWSAAFATSMTAAGDESWMGFGERFNKVDQHGKSLYSWPEEGGLSQGEKAPASASNPFPNGETMTYYPVPFFVSTAGYGFWLDSTWRNQFDMASDRPDAWRVWHIGPTLAYEIFVPATGDPRSPGLQLVDDFTAATGRPMLPPRWSFGPRRRINREAMVNGVLETQAMRDQGLAITALDDATHFLPAASEIGNEVDIAAWTASARALGYRAIAYYNPYFAAAQGAPNAADTQKALANKWFLADASGTPSKVWLISGAGLDVYTIDFTNPDAVTFFTGQLSRALDLGYSGWMYDFGEYVQPSTVTHSGQTGESFHNQFPVLYDKAQHDALEGGARKGDWYAFARSGYTGSSAFVPNAWSGDPDASFSDAEGVPAMVRAGINLGVSGVPNWGSDIGGYKCIADGAVAADGELLARWIELGMLSDNMHDEDSCSGGNGQKATIWSSPDAQAAWRTYALLHTRMFPYFYALATAASTTGAPLQRSLWLEHADHPEWARVDDQLYLGDALMAAPVVVRGQRARNVIFPKGNWLDILDHTLITGTDAAQMIAAPLGKLPLWLRDGHLLVLLDPTIATLDEGTHPGVIGPADVATVYDVLGLVSTTVGAASSTLADGGSLAVKWTGTLDASSLTIAASEAALSTCDGCALVDPPAGGLQRVRVSSSKDVTAGGLTLHAEVGRRVRWDLFLAGKTP